MRSVWVVSLTIRCKLGPRPLSRPEIFSINYDSYYDCWKCKTERLNAVFQGIVEADGQTENAIRHRINVTNKTNNTKDQTVASIYNNCFCIPLDFEILEPAFLSISMV